MQEDENGCYGSECEQSALGGEKLGEHKQRNILMYYIRWGMKPYQAVNE